MISVIIPCKTKADLCPELLPALKNAQIMIVDDQTCPGSPAGKRDWAANRAKGNILAFIDSDAYPDKNWLNHAQKLLKPAKISAVCGPGLTPPTDNWRQKISGLVWSSWLGAGAAGTYRNRQEKSRLVDDYPTFNFLVKKTDFLKIKGFNTQFWPGEDTKLCHDLVYKLNQQILYSPQIIVYHHRRRIFIPHLQQIFRYGCQRGRFMKLFPKTSLRPGYFLPLLIPLVFPAYFIALLLTGIIHRSLLLIPAIFFTHLIYALGLIIGLLSPNTP